MANHKYAELSKLVISIFEKDGFDAGLNYLDDCIEKNPNFLEAYLVRGEFYLETGNFEEAINDFEKAIKINPNEPESYAFRGLLYVKSNGDINKALNDFSKVIELDASDVRAYTNRAHMYLKLQKPQKAISDCTKAIELSPNNTEPYYNRGLAYAKIGEFTKALEDYNKVIELAPENVEAYIKRGFLHSQLGNVQEAIRDYEKFLELDPNNKNATLVRDALKELRSGKTSSEPTSQNSEFKRALIIMIIGCVIGCFIGCFIAASSGRPGYAVDTSYFLIGGLICAFLGMGLGPFMFAVKEFFIRTPYVIKNMIKDEIANKGFFEGFFIGFFQGLIGVVIYGFFKLGWELIKSPFIAIDRLIVSNENGYAPIIKAIAILLLIIAGIIGIFIWDMESIVKKETTVLSTELAADELLTESDGKTYKTVKIGSQTWMAENLNTEKGNSVCYGNNPANCQKCGRLYDWATAMKACPKGWHLPTDAEWTALGNAVGSSSTAGTMLKSKSGWDSGGSGIDKHDFSALPCGRYYDGKFLYYGLLAQFWSATESSKSHALGIGLDARNADMSIGNLNKSLYLRSVRCLQD